ncbi:hypothetical protein L2E82_33712 [Cichorium intybus]|uniref:Uncharacterized protein n=1 Tax=Cichorium intybus TaxID=13427 RepID=A0ACB9BKX1_CICIN|nr:hypothetical protein L2E82_33712 [Cichorium intybus]
MHVMQQQSVGNNVDIQLARFTMSTYKKNLDEVTWDLYASEAHMNLAESALRWCEGKVRDVILRKGLVAMYHDFTLLTRSVSWCGCNIHGVFLRKWGFDLPKWVMSKVSFHGISSLYAFTRSEGIGDLIIINYFDDLPSPVPDEICVALGSMPQFVEPESPSPM